MDPITTPGPIHDVAEHLFLQLGKETLMDCRLVSKAWKKFLDRPTFWFKKLTFEDDFVEEGWKSLAKVVMENNDIDDEVKDHFVLPLMKMYSGNEWPPLNIVWVLNEFKITSATPNYEDPILSQFILEHISQEQDEAESGMNSMFYAAVFGYTEVIKRKITNWKDVNEESDDSGTTALHLAAENGEFAIPFFLSLNFFSLKYVISFCDIASNLN